MPNDVLRAALHDTADLIADYLADVERHPVLPPVVPGELAARLDGPAPEEPTPIAQILADVEREIVPNVTHWQHPAFFAYFA
jgi:aromatic-L-amino-acid decarboxylase